ncbi:rCG62951 [Rattus norvegicus]|uniref:RCG62951 n=1 Tax=Rattus norvegicus TaxID=10116 RepID=A6JPM1_RAT|nr:rCG62951 [Rattus norvegicus]
MRNHLAPVSHSQFHKGIEKQTNRWRGSSSGERQPCFDEFYIPTSNRGKKEQDLIAVWRGHFLCPLWSQNLTHKDTQGPSKLQENKPPLFPEDNQLSNISCPWSLWQPE